MRRKLLKIISLTLTTALCAFGLPGAVAQAEGFDVFVSKNEISQYGTGEAIQRALNTARDCSTDSRPCTVTVEAGNYQLGNCLYIYSNTKLVLTGVTLKKSPDRGTNLLHVGVNSESHSAPAGYYYRNISVEGGIFDGNGGTNTVIKAAHGANISFTSTTFQNDAAHLMEVAAIDGLTLKNCRFRNQTIPADSEYTYEAVQVDVLVKQHFNTYRMEDLPCKNISVDGCSFENCPRGIGSHTSINNAPHQNISVKNCTFRNMTSCGIHFEGVRNLTISDNLIDNAPRGIAVYSVHNPNGDGCYKASVAASEGGTTVHVSDSYKTPADAKITICRNMLKRCGEFRDAYAQYECSGISAVGYNVAASNKTINKGDYYLTGVNIYDNDITVRGHGIRFSHVRNCNADNNRIWCYENTHTPANYYGIVANTDSRVGKISNNIIKNAQRNGIFVYESSAGYVSGNAVLKTGNYGITLEKARVNNILGNTIRDTVYYGIHLNGGTADSIACNGISGTGLNPFNFCNSANGGSVSNNVVSYGGNYYCYDATSTAKQGKLYTSDPTKSVKLSAGTLNMNVGEKYTLAKTLTPLNAVTSVIWTSSNNSVASVSYGTVTAKKEGSVDITVKTFNGKTAACRVNVADPVKNPTISLSAASVKLGVGEQYRLAATTAPANSAVSWSSSDPGVVSVANGRLTANGEGTATVTAALSNGTYAFCTVTVLSAPTSIKMNEESVILGAGESFTLSEITNSGSYANAANLSWTVSDGAVVSITNKSGNKAVVKALKTGSADVSVRLYNGMTATARFTVKPAPSSVSLSRTSVTVGEGETVMISESSNPGSYANAANLKWSSSDPYIASVSQSTGNKAVIRGNHSGSATVKIQLYNGKTASCTVRVKPAPESVSVNPPSFKLGLGETLLINETTNQGSYANADNIKWSSANNAIATVTKSAGNKALVRAVSTGTTIITVRLYNGKTASCAVTVKKAPSALSLSDSSATLRKGQSFTISESTDSGSYANAANLKWNSSNTKVATVTKGSGNKAVIKGVNSGTCYVSITLYNGKKASCKVTVK